MRYFEYEDKKTGEKHKAVDVVSALENMNELETYNGVTESKLADLWYELKRQFRQVTVTPAPGTRPPRDPEEMGRGPEPENVDELTSDLDRPPVPPVSPIRGRPPRR